MSYPRVRNEFATLEMLLRGYSIARFGDGEFKMIDGKGYRREPTNKRLGAEMLRVLRAPHPRCIVGIPTMNPKGPKYANWARHQKRFERILEGSTVDYYSAFISRPDSAPWIRTRDFATKVETPWRGKCVAVVCEKRSGALRAVKLAAQSTVHIECPSERAYSLIDLFERAVIDAKPDIAILSCGPTATCLANRLAARGIQAIDFGSGGSFIAKLLDE